MLFHISVPILFNDSVELADMRKTYLTLYMVRQIEEP